jgi:secondary thiamine-phosphate synthase enzyme
VILPRRHRDRAHLGGTDGRGRHRCQSRHHCQNEALHAGTLRQNGRTMQTIELTLDASKERIIDITTELERFCADLGDGLVNVFVPHATAGVALMETGSGSDGDLLAALERLLPRDDRYRHAHGSQGHGADHILPAFVSPSVTLPVLGGRVAVGTWQSVVLVDLNVDNPRRHVRFSFVPSPAA